MGLLRTARDKVTGWFGNTLDKADGYTDGFCGIRANPGGSVDYHIGHARGWARFRKEHPLLFLPNGTITNNALHLSDYQKDDGSYQYGCRVCGQECEVLEPAEFDPRLHYCGGSPRCLP